MKGAGELTELLQRLHNIGIALSMERDLDRLLEMIVEEARRFTGADGGTLYLASDDSLQFTIVQTESLGIRMGGATGAPIAWPAVPLVVEGEPNHDHVSAYCAMTGEVKNIPDVYEAQGFDFTGTRRFDESSGYRSQSMLVVPMRDHQGSVIGVLQLLNARDEATGQTIPFDKSYEPLVASLASQAAVAIDNVRLIQSLEELFEAFVRVMASAIDERSPATAGHIERVTHLTMALARAINDTDEPPFDKIHFSDDELNELRIAALVHDMGKVATPLHVIEKRTKLEGIRDRIDVVEERFRLIKETIRNKYLLKRVQLLERLGAPDGDGADWKGDPEAGGSAAFAQKYTEQLSSLMEAEAAELAEAEEEWAFVKACNEPMEFMPDEHVARLQAIAAKTFVHDGAPRPYLTDEELEALSIQRGNISGEELQIMRDHAAVTIRLLDQIPFTRKLKNVPKYAGAHHEKLNGKGYPLGLTAEDLTLQTRIITIADVYEALTASDRSYKKERTPEEAMRILGFMVKDGELDGDLVDLFIRSGAYRRKDGDGPGEEVSA